MHESAGERTEVAQFMKIYRSREVGQSYLTSVGTTLVAIVHALWLVFKIKPQVVLFLPFQLLHFIPVINLRIEVII